MRRVHRGACPPELDGPKSLGASAREKAIAFYAISSNHTKSFRFRDVYKAAGVVAELKRLFYGKCSYCESYIAHIEPGDVEHYRPKGGYTDPSGALIKPGYYWLATEWNNLLLSCVDCNRGRKKEDHDGVRRKSGKGNHFPLADESTRAGTPGDEHHEIPMLLDPCNDDVESMLEFTDDAVVRPSQNSGIEMARAQVTIDILGLQRSDLVARRMDHMLKVEAAIARYRRFTDLARRISEDPDAEKVPEYVKTEISRLADASLRELTEYCSGRVDYSAMTRQRVRREFPEILRGISP